MRLSVATIDLAVLLANYQALQAQGRPGKVLAVVKANAYGHGLIPCALALAPVVDGFAVAFAEEGAALRQAGVHVPIVVLEGALNREEWSAFAHHRLWPVIHHADHLDALMGFARCGKPLPEQLWVKLDTGMHRLGFPPCQARSVAESLSKLGVDRNRVVWITHLACADEPKHEANALALNRFAQTLAALPDPFQPPMCSIANSAALLAIPAATSHWARPGIALYGASPFADRSLPAPLRPVMTLTAPIMATRWIDAGEQVGYGGAFVAEQRTRVGVVAIGYADGYPRTAPTGTPVAVEGRITRTIGRVSMDMLTIDLTDLPETVGVGSSVELWGAAVSVDAVAAQAGTIGYELLCRVQRVLYHYCGTESPLCQ